MLDQEGARAILTPSTDTPIRKSKHFLFRPISNFGIPEIVLRYLDFLFLAMFAHHHAQESRSLKARHRLFVKTSLTYLHHDSNYPFTSKASR
jgi:hypothetical protein